MKKLIIHSQEYLRFVLPSDISYCKSDNCYTTVFLNSGEELIICKSLKRITQELDPMLFIRVNQSYLVNKECIKLIDKRNKFVELDNNQRIPFTTTINELLSLISPNIAITLVLFQLVYLVSDAIAEVL